MTKLRRALGPLGHESMMHWCPGCQEVHGIRIVSPDGGPTWTFNKDMETPHFEPSVRYFVIEREDDDDKPLPQPIQRTLCHYFIHNGRIEFCGDSPHALAGKTVDIPEWPYAKGAYGGIED